MAAIITLDDLLVAYNDQVVAHCMQLRKVLLANLPDVTEQ